MDLMGVEEAGRAAVAERAATRRSVRIRHWLRSPWLPLAALAVVVCLDAVAQARDWPLPLLGLLDEPAHLATAWILLAAVLPLRRSGLVPWALAGAVLIDLDHVPLYLWGVLADANGGRPVTHCLATAALLAVAGLVLTRLRTPLLGLALGVVLHLVRDLGTGPGVPLLEPFSSTVVLVPYAAYLAPLAAVAAGVTVRNAWLRRRA
jgi:inner membrane protein